MTTALEHLHTLCHRDGTERLRDIAIGLEISLADGLEILKIVDRLATRLAETCTDHYRCALCNEWACDSCRVGCPGYCAHEEPTCLSCWPGDCRECQETAAEETAYAKNDRPWGAPA